MLLPPLANTVSRSAWKVLGVCLLVVPVLIPLSQRLQQVRAHSNMLAKRNLRVDLLACRATGKRKYNSEKAPHKPPPEVQVSWASPGCHCYTCLHQEEVVAAVLELRLSRREDHISAKEGHRSASRLRQAGPLSMLPHAAVPVARRPSTWQVPQVSRSVTAVKLKTTAHSASIAQFQCVSCNLRLRLSFNLKC